MVSSFIITPEYFKTPEDGKIARESGIENRYNRALERTDPGFTVDKDDWSDGVIRYTVDGEIKFYGIQECKRLKTSNSIYERIVQGLAYVATWLSKYPELKSKFKVLVLPTEKFIDILYLDNLLNSSFWAEFCFYFDVHKNTRYGKDKGSASNFYSKSPDVVALIMDYKDRFCGSHRVIDEELDFKEVTEEILSNCL